MKRTQPHADSANPVDLAAANVLKSLMATRGHRLEDVVAGTGISRATVQRRRQVGGFTLSEVAALAAFYDVPIAWFVDPPEGLRHPGGQNSVGLTGFDMTPPESALIAA